MPLAFNFDGKRALPRVLSDIYHFRPIERIYTLTMSSGAEVAIDVAKVMNAAWKHLADNCAQSRTCNAYFSGLRGGKNLTLSQCMEQTFYIHRLAPKTRTRSGKQAAEEDLPLANTAGNDIGISIYALADGQAQPDQMAATLLHEIAHYAGASTNTRDERSLDAEKALLSCGLGKYYNELAKG